MGNFTRTQAYGKGMAQDRTLLQKTFIASGLEVGGNHNSPHSDHLHGKGHWVTGIAACSIETYDFGASEFNTASGGMGTLVEQLIDVARAWDLGASASAMSVCCRTESCRGQAQNFPPLHTTSAPSTPDPSPMWALCTSRLVGRNKQEDDWGSLDGVGEYPK